MVGLAEVNIFKFAFKINGNKNLTQVPVTLAVLEKIRKRLPEKVVILRTMSKKTFELIKDRQFNSLDTYGDGGFRIDEARAFHFSLIEPGIHKLPKDPATLKLLVPVEKLVSLAKRNQLIIGINPSMIELLFSTEALVELVEDFDSVSLLSDSSPG